MADRQTFLLGIGCQKAGTTWLWDYLDGVEGTTLAWPKELHVLDAMLRPDLNAEFWLRAKVQELSRPAPSKFSPKKFGLGKSAPQPRKVEPEQRVAMMANPQLYADFFRAIDPAARVVGEITPSYATLGADHFAFIRDLLEPHFDLRIVLLLRDPVARAFSAAKHLQRLYAKDFPVALGGDASAYLESILTSSYILERQDYARVLTNLDTAFAPGQVHVEFYERLFTPTAVRAITDFLGLPATDADFDKRRNAGMKAAPLDPPVARRAREAYADTYDYCEARFGKAVIEELWMPAGG